MAANMMRASDFVRLLPICEIGGVVRGHIGARVITTASAANHSYVRGLGADEVIDYNAQDFTKPPSGCDAGLDTVGADVAQRTFAVLKPGGRAAFIASGSQAPKALREAMCSRCGPMLPAIGRISIA